VRIVICFISTFSCSRVRHMTALMVDIGAKGYGVAQCQMSRRATSIGIRGAFDDRTVGDHRALAWA
jgi:hypothetical protein